MTHTLTLHEDRSPSGEWQNGVEGKAFIEKRARNKK